MSKTKIFLLVMAAFAVLIFASLSWYKLRYSMDIVEPFEVSAPNAKHQLLIATQGSNYKDAVVSGVIAALKDEPVFIRVIDVSGLSAIDHEQWSALVILHTWENWEPQADAKQFLDELSPLDMSKIIVLTTSGAGDYKMEGIDAITSASVLSDIPRNVETIVQRVKVGMMKP